MADSYIQKQDKHQVYLSRLAGGILKEDIYPGINNAYRSVYSILREHGDISSIRELNQVTKAVTAAIKESVGEGFAAATASMSAIAVNEAAYQAAALSLMSDTVLKAPGEPRVNKYTRESIMSLTSGKRVTSGVWPSFVKGYEDSMSREYNSIITAAYSESLSTGKMATLNQLSQRLRNANNELLARDAEALVRTGVQHYAGKASQLMAADNSDIIEREIPIVTFDSRTTDICISISAKYPKGWSLGKSPIGYPPYHYQCRTIIGYLLKGQTELEGTRSAKGSEGGSQIAANTPFAKFLREQPKDYIYETLGRKRGELFIAGKLPLANLTDKYLNPLPISKLNLTD